MKVVLCELCCKILYGQGQDTYRVALQMAFTWAGTRKEWLPSYLWFIITAERSRARFCQIDQPKWSFGSMCGYAVSKSTSHLKSNEPADVMVKVTSRGNLCLFKDVWCAAAASHLRHVWDCTTSVTNAHTPWSQYDWRLSYDMNLPASLCWQN